MLSRQRFIRAAAMVAAAPSLLQACASAQDDHGYDAAVRSIWHAGAGAAAQGADLQRELVRHATLAAFDGRPVSNADLALLERAGTGPGVQVLLLTRRDAMERVLAQVVQANSAQMRDPAFVAELRQWIRFGEAEAVRTSDGLFSAASGNPTVPRWLGSALFGAFFTERNENDKYAAHVRSSAGIAVFVSDADDAAHWVQAGRCYERFALQATALGIRNAMLNQPVEVPAARPGFAAALGLAAGCRPDLVVRFGRGPAMPRSLRRPVSAVLV